MSQLRTNAIVDASGGTTATVNGIPLRPGVLDPENRIINGAFDFWQRGTSSTSSGYLADRWRNDVSGGTVTTSRQAFALGDTFGNNSPTYFLRQSSSGQSLAGSYSITEHRVEGVRSYAGQTITLLGWARRSSGSGNMAVEMAQAFGTGGSPSSSVLVSPQTVTLTGSWSPFALTFAVPSISGKTLGTNNNDFLQILFWTSAGSTWNARTNSLGLQTIGVDLWGIHIKQGTHTTSAVDLYRQPELGPELERCQRYYEKSYPLDVNPGSSGASCPETTSGVQGAVTTSEIASGKIRFSVVKRAYVTIGLWDPSGNQSKVDRVNFGVTNNLNQSATVQDATDSGFRLYSASGSSGSGLIFQWTADSEL